MESTRSEYEVTDIGLATSFVVEGFVLKTIRPVDHRRSAFVFENADEMARVERDYWANRLLVPAQQFHQQLKFTKNRLYGSRGV
jgi:hypothetical protein